MRDGRYGNPAGQAEGPSVSKLLVRVRIIGTLFYGDLRVVFLEILVKQGDMTYDAQPIGKDARLLCIAEMAVDVLLLYGGVGGGMAGHQRVDAFIWVKTRCELSILRNTASSCGRCGNRSRPGRGSTYKVL